MRCEDFEVQCENFAIKGLDFVPAPNPAVYAPKSLATEAVSHDGMVEVGVVMKFGGDDAYQIRTTRNPKGDNQDFCIALRDKIQVAGVWYDGSQHN